MWPGSKWSPSFHQSTCGPDNSQTCFFVPSFTTLLRCMPVKLLGDHKALAKCKKKVPSFQNNYDPDFGGLWKSASAVKSNANVASLGPPAALIGLNGFLADHSRLGRTSWCSLTAETPDTIAIAAAPRGSKVNKSESKCVLEEAKHRFTL